MKNISLAFIPVVALVAGCGGGGGEPSNAVNLGPVLQPLPVSSYAITDNLTVQFPLELPLVSLEMPTYATGSKEIKFIIKNNNIVPNAVKLLVYNSVNSEIIANAIFTAPKSQSEKTIALNDGKTAPSSLNYSFTYSVGASVKGIDEDNFLYPLDLAVKATVSQSRDGPQTSHINDPNAIDFSAPEGTIIIASKSGIVISAVDSFKIGGLDPSLVDKQNYINIYHDDGATSNYGHLSYASLLVAPGTQVTKGQPIARVGNTGLTSGSHLHFGVTYIDLTFNTRSIFPIIRDSKGSLITIKYLATIGGS